MLATKKKNTYTQKIYIKNIKSILSVADGVGNWITKGVDPSLYSKGLCNTLSRLHLENKKKY
jgi:hypothetical protein